MPTVSEKEELLEERGWEHDGTDERGDQLWKDPMGSVLKRLPPQEVLLPQREGPPQLVKQQVGAPVAWSYTLSNAYVVQHARDVAEGLSQPTPLERIAALERRVNMLETAVVDAARSLEPLQRRAVPERTDNLRTEVHQLRNTAADTAKKLLEATKL